MSKAHEIVRTLISIASSTEDHGNYTVEKIESLTDELRDHIPDYEIGFAAGKKWRDYVDTLRDNAIQALSERVISDKNASDSKLVGGLIIDELASPSQPI